MRVRSSCVFPLVAVLCVGGPAMAQTFHFTVTADPRDYHAAFGNVLQGINDHAGGPGAFHASVGDIDHTIPENRVEIDTAFGASAIWYPIIGNHEKESPADMTWLRNEYDNGNGSSIRTPLKNVTNQDGPNTCKQTTYSWDYGNAHFVALNQYWDGTSDTGTDGDIIPALYNWLAADLAANTKPFTFVFGHEPAYPFHRHVGNSLDKYPDNRDAFWALLEAEGVQAFFCGHTHYYSKYQNPGGSVWQFDAGNAGNEPEPNEGQTFFDVVVGNDQAVIDVYRDGGTGTFSLYESVTVVPEPSSLSFLAAMAVPMLRRRRRPASSYRVTSGGEESPRGLSRETGNRWLSLFFRREGR